MICLLSPAKSLNLTSPDYPENVTQPIFQDESLQIADVLKKWNPKKISKVMEISDKLAKENFERYQHFGTMENMKNIRPAGFMFHGDVYLGLDIETIPKEDLPRTQNTLRILSGMYGLLRPMDAIEPYRLEMGTDIRVNRKKNLYDFWQKKVTAELVEEMEKRNETLLVNLASIEYSKAVDFKKIKTDVLDVSFLDYKDGKYKNISFFIKKARGYMARYIILNDIKNKNDIKSFDSERYSFNEKMSDENHYVFTREYQLPK